MNMNLLTGILAVIVAVDHVLAGIPSVNASSTFQLITKGIQYLAGFFPNSNPSNTTPQPPAAK